MLHRGNQAQLDRLSNLTTQQFLTPGLTTLLINAHSEEDKGLTPSNGKAAKLENWSCPVGLPCKSLKDTFKMLRSLEGNLSGLLNLLVLRKAATRQKAKGSYKKITVIVLIPIVQCRCGAAVCKRPQNSF